MLIEQINDDDDKKQTIKDRQREQYVQTDNKSMLKWNKMTILVLQNKLINPNERVQIQRIITKQAKNIAPVTRHS